MKNFSRAVSWIGVGLFSIGLMLYIYLGIYNRFWADDWCYNADLKTLGLWGTIQGYSFITHYASNRFSLTLFTGLLQMLGVLSVKLTAFLVVVFWFGSLLLLVVSLNQFFRLQINRLVLILMALALEYYALYLAPNQFQILYWRAGLLPYSAPLILTFAIFGLLFWQASHEVQVPFLVYGIALLAFVAGGFSEGACVVLVMSLGLFWLAVLWFRRKDEPWAKRVWTPTSVALGFAILAMVGLIISPANAPRHIGHYPDPMNPILVPFYSILFTFDFIQSSVRSLLVPHLAFALLFFLLPFLSMTIGNKANFTLIASLKAMLAILAITVLLIAVSQAPTVYIEKGPPAPRGMIFSRFMLLLAIAVVFWLAGNLLASRIKQTSVLVLLPILALLSLAYTIRPISLTYSTLPVYMERAKIWDERNTEILNAKAQGNLQIDVRGIDGAPVGHIRDLKEKSTFWINACAATYYGMDEIRATKP